MLRILMLLGLLCMALTCNAAVFVPPETFQPPIAKRLPLKPNYAYPLVVLPRALLKRKVLAVNPMRIAYQA